MSLSEATLRKLSLKEHVPFQWSFVLFFLSLFKVIKAFGYLIYLVLTWKRYSM